MLVPYLVSGTLAVLALATFSVSWRRARGSRRVRATVVSLSVGSAKRGDGFGISPIFEYINDLGGVVRASYVSHGRHALMPKLGDEVDIYIDAYRPQYASLDRPPAMWLASVLLLGLAGLAFYLEMLGV